MLPLEWWERDGECRDAKRAHQDKIDRICESRESLILQTTLWLKESEMEHNLFPYATPSGIEHYTLWSLYEMSHSQIVTFVDNFLHREKPHARRWQYDDNMGERSIDLFHIHVFVETHPFAFSPSPGNEYFPPHLLSRMKRQCVDDVEVAEEASSHCQHYGDDSFNNEGINNCYYNHHDDDDDDDILQECNSSTHPFPWSYRYECGVEDASNDFEEREEEGEEEGDWERGQEKEGARIEEAGMKEAVERLHGKKESRDE